MLIIFLLVILKMCQMSNIIRPVYITCVFKTTTLFTSAALLIRIKFIKDLFTSCFQTSLYRQEHLYGSAW